MQGLKKDATVYGSGSFSRCLLVSASHNMIDDKGLKKASSSSSDRPNATRETGGEMNNRAAASKKCNYNP